MRAIPMTLRFAFTRVDFGHNSKHAFSQEVVMKLFVCVSETWWAFFISRSKTSASGSFTCLDSEMDIASDTSPDYSPTNGLKEGGYWTLRLEFGIVALSPFTDCHTQAQ
ncbi:hypothetical protein CEXT_374201 [Caerostris extrusa]|uniref:Uncharacterized protein n=1 Tax=Caerostris extrusa TaxID=172846 RepID=A0AAV4Y6J9_CAEEX|nr:hypothetical protein CEXT_374201 [Caerostris extrusa]